MVRAEWGVQGTGTGYEVRVLSRIPGFSRSGLARRASGALTPGPPGPNRVWNLKGCRPSKCPTRARSPHDNR